VCEKPRIPDSRPLAPLKWRGPTREQSRADAYALGAIGFFLVTGREVFTGRSVIEVCGKHLNAAPQSPSEVNVEGRR
jgi:hypothetical protein